MRLYRVLKAISEWSKPLAGKTTGHPQHQAHPKTELSPLSPLGAAKQPLVGPCRTEILPKATVGEDLARRLRAFLHYN